MGSAAGWTVLFGGNSGTKPRFADAMASCLTTEEAQALVGRLLAYFSDHAGPKERTARFVERVGIDTIRNDLGLAGPEATG
jgi:NAD(P)H-nitrite reductase large subunit